MPVSNALKAAILTRLADIGERDGVSFGHITVSPSTGALGDCEMEVRAMTYLPLDQYWRNRPQFEVRPESLEGLPGVAMSKLDVVDALRHAAGGRAAMSDMAGIVFATPYHDSNISDVLVSMPAFTNLAADVANGSAARGRMMYGAFKNLADQHAHQLFASRSEYDDGWGQTVTAAAKSYRATNADQIKVNAVGLVAALTAAATLRAGALPDPAHLHTPEMMSTVMPNAPTLERLRAGETFDAAVIAEYANLVTNRLEQMPPTFGPEQAAQDDYRYIEQAVNGVVQATAHHRVDLRALAGYYQQLALAEAPQPALAAPQATDDPGEVEEFGPH